jgi:hypothetical protein
MRRREMLRQLIDLARDAGIEVREMGGSAGGDGGAPAASGICRVRQGFWVMLAQSDSLDDRIEVLASALSDHAAPFLESRYLPPAIRERLGEDPGVA